MESDRYIILILSNSRRRMAAVSILSISFYRGVGKDHSHDYLFVGCVHLFRE